MAARSPRWAALALVLLTGCGDVAVSTVPPAPSPSSADVPAPTTTAVAGTTTVPAPTNAQTSPTVTAPPDLLLTRDDVDCSPEALSEGGEEEVVVAHFVVEGTLGAVCFGDEDPTLVEAWELLYLITPPHLLEPLAVFAGFDGPSSDTLAFVGSIDLDGTMFQMTMNLPLSDPDDPEFALTVAHEFAHILAANADQIDRLADPNACLTYDTGEGCAYPGSYILDWVEAFWSDAELAQLGPDEEAGAGERCRLNEDFLGEYAASNPDEDFAESFAAFVFQLDVDTPGQQDKLDFFASRPQLAAFRERAAAAGLAGLPNQFDLCG